MAGRREPLLELNQVLLQDLVLQSTPLWAEQLATKHPENQLATPQPAVICLLTAHYSLYELRLLPPCARATHPIC